jgi:hypothetical protein
MHVDAANQTLKEVPAIRILITHHAHDACADAGECDDAGVRGAGWSVAARATTRVLRGQGL